MSVGMSIICIMGSWVQAERTPSLELSRIVELEACDWFVVDGIVSCLSILEANFVQLCGR